MIYLNSTQSTAAQKTVSTVFPHALRYQNMMIAGFDPIIWDPDRWKASLEAWTIRGTPVIDPLLDEGVLDQILAEDTWRGGPTWEDRTRILALTTDEPVITDDNMATEWWAFDTYPSVSWRGVRLAALLPRSQAACLEHSSVGALPRTHGRA